MCSHLLRKRGLKSKFVQNLPLRVWVRQKLGETQKKTSLSVWTSFFARIVNVEPLGGEKNDLSFLNMHEKCPNTKCQSRNLEVVKEIKAEIERLNLKR